MHARRAWGFGLLFAAACGASPAGGAHPAPARASGSEPLLPRDPLPLATPTATAAATIASDPSSATGRASADPNAPSDLPARCRELLAALACGAERATGQGPAFVARARELEDELAGLSFSTARAACESAAASEPWATALPGLGCAREPPPVAVPSPPPPDVSSGSGTGFASAALLAGAAVRALDSHDVAAIRALFPTDALIDSIARCGDATTETPKGDVHRELRRTLERSREVAHMTLLRIQERDEKTVQKGTTQHGCSVLETVRVVRITAELRVTDARGQTSDTTEHVTAIVLRGKWFLVDT